MVRKLSLAALAVVVACASGVAQEKKDAPRYTSAGAWVVTKGDLKDPKSWGNEKPIADFATEKEAEDYAHKLNQQSEADPYRWVYNARKRKDDDPKGAGPAVVENTGPKGGLVTNPGLKTVDPGDIKLSGGKAKSVTGQTGTGVIGDKKVTITFTGKDGKGKFKVDGELTGEGEWEQSGAGVTFETVLSKFRGVVRGDKLAGVRFVKKPGEDGKNALTEWSVDLKESPKGADAVGVWKRRTVYGEDTPQNGGIKDYEATLTINSDGTASYVLTQDFTFNGRKFPRTVDVSWKGTWKVESGKLVVTPSEDRWSRFKMTMDYSGEKAGDFQRAK